MNATQQKNELRQAILARLKAIPSAQRAADSAGLRALLFPILGQMQSQFRRPLRVALYAPLPHEVNLLPLLHEYPQHEYAFPRCLPGRQLAFHVVKEPASELVAGALGILAPLPTLPQIEAEALDLVVVPGVAFSSNGARLGYGGGYYDRWLPRCTRARLLALAFAEQMLAEGVIPCAPHDLLLPQVIQA